MDKQKIEILHEHYQESFTYIRERERKRDRFFLFLILLVGALFLQVQYPINFKEALGDLNIQNAELNLRAIPLEPLLSVTWTFLMVLSLQYCQLSINTERQYSYLHLLEDRLSKAFGDEDMYRREGKVYLDKYPLFSEWAWIFYTIMFPLIMVASVPFLLYLELSQLNNAVYYKIYDGLLGLGVIISFLLYRICPLFSKRKKSASVERA